MINFYHPGLLYHVRMTLVVFNLGQVTPQCIRNGEFVEMANLLPDRLASSNNNELTKSKKHRIVTNTYFERVQCFGLYISTMPPKEC